MSGGLTRWWSKPAARDCALVVLLSPAGQRDQQQSRACPARARIAARPRSRPSRACRCRAAPRRARTCRALERGAAAVGDRDRRAERAAAARRASPPRRDCRRRSASARRGQRLRRGVRRLAPRGAARRAAVSTTNSLPRAEPSLSRLDRAAVHRHQAAHQRQPDAEAALRAAARAIDLREHVEHRRQAARRAMPMPLSRTVTTARSPCRVTRDARSARRAFGVLRRVVQQVREHLRQPHRVAVDATAARRAARRVARGRRRRAAGRLVSIAACTTAARSSGSRRTSIEPARDARHLEQSSTSRTRWLTCRSITAVHPRDAAAVGAARLQQLHAPSAAAPADCAARARASRGTRPCAGRRAAALPRPRALAGARGSGTAARARAAPCGRALSERRDAHRPLEQRDVAERAHRVAATSAESAPARVRTRTGRSDHGGCVASSVREAAVSAVRRALLGQERRPRRRAISRSELVERSGTRASANPRARAASAVVAASLAVGARTSTRRSRSSSAVTAPSRSFATGLSYDGHAGQHAAELAQRLADADRRRVEPELADGPLVRAAALLHHRDRLPHLALRLRSSAAGSTASAR